MPFDAPEPPDPVATANAQGAANREAAIAGSIVNNNNETGPYGNVTYTQSGVERVQRDDGSYIEVPRYTRNVQLTPQQQQMLDQQNRLGIGLNDLALGQVSRLDNVLAEPIDTSNLTAYRNVSGNDYEQSRRSVEDALLTRLDRQYGEDRQSIEAQLSNQGIARNSEAWNRGIDELNRSREEARMNAVLAGGQEQSRLRGMELTEADFSNQVRSQQLAELLGVRNQPINEVSALMSGGQVTLPQFAAPYRQGIAAAPIADTTYRSYQARADAAAARNQGLFGILGAGLGAAPLFF